MHYALYYTLYYMSVVFFADYIIRVSPELTQLYFLITCVKTSRLAKNGVSCDRKNIPAKFDHQSIGNTMCDIMLTKRGCDVFRPPLTPFMAKFFTTLSGPLNATIWYHPVWKLIRANKLLHRMHATPFYKYKQFLEFNRSIN